MFNFIKRCTMKKENFLKTLTPNDFRRLAWMVGAFVHAGKLSLSEMNSRWQRASINVNGEAICTNTFKNWRKLLESEFGIWMDYDARDNYRYFIVNPEVLDEKNMAMVMLRTMILEVAMLSVVDGGRMLTTQMAPGAEHAAVIADCIDQKKVLQFTYRRFEVEGKRSIAKVHQIEPWCMKFFRDRLYVMGLDVSDECKVKRFSLDRMQHPRQMASNFMMAPDEELIYAFKNVVGVTMSAIKPCRVRVRAFGKLPSYLRTRPIHCSQREEAHGEDYAEFGYWVSPTIDFQQELLAEMKEILVLEPQWLASEMEKNAEDYICRSHEKAI